MIGYFRRKKEEREQLRKTISSLAVSANKLSESLDDLGEFREGLTEILIEKLTEIKDSVEKSGGIMLQVSTPMREVGEKLAKYFDYELRTFEKIQEEQSKKTKYDDLF
jgi:predicted  nucleic acid-binding Zn-ribbon protein